MQEAMSIERHMFDNAAEKGLPLYGVLELLPLCNMSCRMCYVRMSREEMEAEGSLLTTKQWCQLAEQMKRAGTLFVLLTGGEPLLYPGFRELYSELRKMGMILTLNTNATLIDEEWADFFAAHKPRRINITLYGSCEETYERLCGLSGGFARTMEGIRLLKERGVDIKINGSLVKENVSEGIRIAEIAKQLEVPVSMDTYMYPAVRTGNSGTEKIRLEPKEAADAYVRILQYELGEEAFRIYGAQRLFEVSHTKEADSSKQMSCQAGKSAYAVTWKGNLQPCVQLREPAISLLEYDFEKAWKALVQRMKQIQPCHTCARCQYRSICQNCAASAAAETGGFDRAAEYLCCYTKQIVKHFEACAGDAKKLRSMG